MTRPTFKEVMAAIGFSLGWAMLKLRAIKHLIATAVAMAVVGLTIVYALPPLVDFAATLPAVPPSVVALVAVAGFLLFGAAAFSYVLFAFLSRLYQSDAGIRRDVQSIIHKVENPLKAAVGVAPESGGGSFHAYTDDRAYLQEQFDELVKAKILRPEDDLDKILKDGDIDLEFLKAKGVTE